MINVETKNDIDLFRIKYKTNKEWEQWVLLMSDEHFDSKDCDRKLLKKHHEMAKKRNAIILKFGDTFDLMGGKYDPRSSKSSLRPEYQVDNYFDKVVEDAVKFYEPYKENIKLITMGNHESSVLRRQETNLLNRLCDGLNVKSGKYSGFIRFQFEREGSVGGRQSKLLYYNHGSGGNSPVTRGVIKTNRRQSFIQSDIFVSGHIHSEWCLNLPMVSINEQGNLVKKEQTHISLGTYKDDSFLGGWCDMNEFPPPNMGGAWLRFHYDKEKGIVFEVIRAI